MNNNDEKLAKLNEQLKNAEQSYVETGKKNKKFFKNPLFIISAVLGALTVGFVTAGIIMSGAAGLGSTFWLLTGSISAIPLVTAGAKFCQVFSKFNKVEKIKENIEKLEKTSNATKKIEKISVEEQNKTIDKVEKKERKITPPVKLTSKSKDEILEK